MNIGRSLSRSIAAARAMAAGSPPGRAGAIGAVAGGASSAQFISRSSGISRNTGPGTFDWATRNAESTYSWMRSVEGTATLHFVTGRISSTWFMSWSDPMS